MYKGLIENLAFVYGFIARGRERMTDEDRRAVAAGSHTLVKCAPAVLGGEDERAQDRADLAEARKMDSHIEEMVVFLEHLEIV